MKNFLIYFGAAIFYGVLISFILTGGIINNYHFSGILNIIKEWFGW